MTARAIVTCAAITNGCMNFLTFEVPSHVDAYALDRNEVPDEPWARKPLEMNGWHEDCGRWVCAVHPVRQEVPA